MIKGYLFRRVAMARACWVLTAILAWAATAHADDLILKNGNVLSGRVISETDSAIVLEVQQGDFETGIALSFILMAVVLVVDNPPILLLLPSLQP
jgi:ABC-type tungstate transport system substrate-binding protein